MLEQPISIDVEYECNQMVSWWQISLRLEVKSQESRNLHT